MSTITTKDGTEIYYKDWGEGPVVTFSHGWPLSSDAWDGQMLFLAQNGFRAVAHDRRGHGRSSQASSGNDMDGYADDLAAVIEALDLRDATLVGHSTGGGEVARYIGRHGTGRVAKAALISAVPPLVLKTAANPEGLPLEALDGLRAGLFKDRSQFYRDLAIQFYGANRPGAKVSQGVLDQFWLWSMQSGLKNAYDSIKAFSETDFTQDLERFDVPTLVLHGEDDQIVPVNDSARKSAKPSRAHRKSTTQARRTASPPPTRTSSTPTCWPSLRASHNRRPAALASPSGKQRPAPAGPEMCDSPAAIRGITDKGQHRKDSS
jgi:non-heme chloroperoxidase